ncbi:DoxX family protein [Neobacillus mesonae]|uniref:DoxX family protein n=1 Tax=Neobacillus mesonae TaxID=1193713 RepID=UPI0020415F2D|nr:DoxX family protein [Neobacillus mesonae]MCM3569461.1 DoxX family protein [Neobacillus mesonae]
MSISFSTMKLIRYVVAYVFIISGLMKLLNTETANHFLSFGLPYPNMMLKLVIILEIGCGIFILVNKSVKTATVPLIAIMIAAILITKLPYLNSGLLNFAFYSKLDMVILVLLIILYNRNP